MCTLVVEERVQAERGIVGRGKMAIEELLSVKDAGLFLGRTADSSRQIV